ncbi:MAG: hypothetical protein QM753_19310 [Thermomicrobiales bacterium]
MRQSLRWRTNAARVVMVLGMLALVGAPSALLAQDATEIPATEEVAAPLETLPDSTLPAVETVLPTDPPLLPTEVPTDAPVIPTVTETLAPPTVSIPTEVPTDSPSPSATVTLTPTVAEREAAFMAQAAPSTGAWLTVDGQTGTVLATYGGTQTLVVGDLLGMAGDGFPLIQASNPDPDFYRFNGWWTTNFFLLYDGRGCQGQFTQEFGIGDMQPTTGTASAPVTGASQTYSVQATQYLSVWWIEKKIDVVDTVDEVTVMPAVARSNCVNVEIMNDAASLLANGSTGSVIVNEGDPIVLLSNQPSGATWTQSIYESTEACSGTLANLVSGGPGSLVGTTLNRPPGTYWFGLRSSDGSTLRYGNCVQVTVQDVRATLRVDGSSGPVSFLTGQTVALYVDGVKPGASLTGLVFPYSTTCTGTANSLTSGVADSAGTLDTSSALNFGADLSVMFVSLAANGSALEYSNCVALWHQYTAINLEVNESIGPVLVDGGEIHLIATGLPPGAVAYAVLGCSGPFDPDDFGQTIGDDGVFEAYMSDDLPDEFSVQVVLGPDGAVSSNCVQVRLVTYLIDPEIAINGSQAPAPVESGQPFTLSGVTFPPDAAVTIRAFPGASDCTGTPTVAGAQSDNEGNFSLDRVAGAAGTISFQAEAGGLPSNCVPLQITSAPIAPTVTPTATVIPTVMVPEGPITLRANGQTDPQTLAGGTAAVFTAENLGTGETYALAWYPSGDCTGTSRSMGGGVAGAGQVGTLTRSVASTVSFMLTAGERTSNCVQVSWLAAVTTPTVTPTAPVVTVTPTSVDSGATATPTPTTATTVTATSTPLDPGGTATVTPTGSAVTATPTGTGSTPTPDPTGTLTPATAITPTPTASAGPVTGLPTTGGGPTQGHDAPLMALLAVVAMTLGMAAFAARRGAGRSR